MAKFLDMAGVTYLWSKIKGSYVSKEAGKDLSSNDYTTSEKNKLSGIDIGANVNVIESVKVNGAVVAPVSKAVSITVPTKVSQLTNDSGLQTAAQVTAAINTAIGGITGISFSVVSSLPATGSNGVIYLVSNGGVGSNIYDEYIYINSKFEKLGTKELDLTGFLRTSDVVEITTAELDVICI